MREVLVVGSLAYDSVKTPSGKAEKSLGGSANYFSVAASLFSQVLVVGVVGEDYSDSDRSILLTRKVDLSGVQTVAGKTFHWEGTYEHNLNEAQTLKTELNVFAHFNPTLPVKYRDSAYVFLANIDPTLQLQVLSQVEKPVFVGIDSMNFWINSKQNELTEVLKKVDIVFMNEAEAKMLTQTSNTTQAIKKVSEMGPKFVVVKKGEYGASLYSPKHGFYQVPALPIENVVDPTGAGDSFAGGFFGSLACRPNSHQVPEWNDLKAATLSGTVLSSQTIQDFSMKALLKVDKGVFELHLTQLKQMIY